MTNDSVVIHEIKINQGCINLTAGGIAAMVGSANSEQQAALLVAIAKEAHSWGSEGMRLQCDFIEGEMSSAEKADVAEALEVLLEYMRPQS